MKAFSIVLAINQTFWKMKNTTVFLFVLLFYNVCSWAQKATIKLLHTDKVLSVAMAQELKIPFKMELSGGYVPSKDENLKATLYTDVEVLNTFIEKEEFLIHGNLVVDTLIFKQKEGSLVKLMNILDTLVKNESIIQVFVKSTNKTDFKVGGTQISMGYSNDFIPVRLINGKKVRNYDYNFFLGANFDMQTQLKTESYYAEIDVFLPDLVTLKKNKSSFGLQAGIYKNNNVRKELENSVSRPIFEIVDSLSTVDSVTVIENRALQTPNVSTSNLGFYGRVLFNLHENKKRNFRAFLALHAELIQRTQTITYESENLIRINQSIMPRDSLRNNAVLLSRILNNGPDTDRFYSSFFGAGIPLRYSGKSIEVSINPVFGFGDKGARVRGGDTFKSFFLAQFHLMEKEHGLRISGEIRKYFNANQNPFVVINLSKRFDISKLLDSNETKDEE